MVLEIVPIYLSGRRALIDRLATELGSRFRIGTRIRDPWFDPEEAYDGRRGQYRATRLLRLLLDEPGDDALRIVGIAGVDLFTPVLTYVFGEAQLDGRAAMVSLHRLRPEVYGLPHDDERLFRRVLTETVHELGHTYGLLHCREPHCAMHASTYVEEIDLKEPDLCLGCMEALFGSSTGGPAAEILPRPARR